MIFGRTNIRKWLLRRKKIVMFAEMAGDNTRSCEKRSPWQSMWNDWVNGPEIKEITHRIWYLEGQISEMYTYVKEVHLWGRWHIWFVQRWQDIMYCWSTMKNRSQWQSIWKWWGYSTQNEERVAHRMWNMKELMSKKYVNFSAPQRKVTQLQRYLSRWH